MSTLGLKQGMSIEGPLCLVEDGVGLRARAAGDGRRLEQLADAAGRVDVVLHRYNEMIPKLIKAKCIQFYPDFGRSNVGMASGFNFRLKGRPSSSCCRSRL